MQDNKIILKKEFKLWLDDIRPAPPGWLYTNNVKDAIWATENYNIVEMSLDHDLGLKNDKFEEYTTSETDLDINDYEETGYDFCLWLTKNNIWPQKITVHSSNLVGAERMLSIIEKHMPNSKRLGQVVENEIN